MCRAGWSHLAEEAAVSVPPRSQAFAALLCAAAKWTPDQRARRDFYRQYVRRGAMVDFAGTFGATCPDPDFVKARVPPKKKPLQLRKQNVAVVGGAIAVVAVGALALVRRRRAAITPSA